MLILCIARAMPYPGPNHFILSRWKLYLCGFGHNKLGDTLHAGCVVMCGFIFFNSSETRWPGLQRIAHPIDCSYERISGIYLICTKMNKHIDRYISVTPHLCVFNSNQFRYTRFMSRQKKTVQIKMHLCLCDLPDPKYRANQPVQDAHFNRYNLVNLALQLFRICGRKCS